VDDTNERKRKPTIKEISGITGFSPATVSLVLNNKGSFTEETRRSIMRVFSELDRKQPVTTERNLLRLLIEESASLFMTDPYNSEIILGIESECRLVGYEIVLTFVRTDSNPRQWLEGVKGLILIGGGLITDSLLMELHDANIPLILVDNYAHKGDLPSIHADHYGAGFLAVEHLISKGHRQIGFISGPAKYKPLLDRYAGYCAALMEYGLPLHPQYVSPNYDRKFVKGYLEMKYLMELPDRPTAVFAVSDRAVLGAVQALQDMGLSHGKDVELAGCDSIPAIRELSPPVATVHVPRWEVGQMTVRFLIEAIKGNTFIGKVVIPCKLVKAGTMEPKTAQSLKS
jgi:LacI family transcriptional regulator